MGRSRYRITSPSQPHFLTLSVLHWIPVFTRKDTVNILLDSLSHKVRHGMKVYAFVVLENHIHLIAQSEALDKDMASFKSFTARKLIDYLKSKQVKTIIDQLAFYKKAHKNDRMFQFWQEGMHPQLVSNEKVLRQKIEYIHQNPVKRGYVNKAEHWRYSSVENYHGKSGLIEIYTDWL